MPAHGYESEWKATDGKVERVYCLENAFIRVKFLPSRGFSIVEWFDKRSDKLVIDQFHPLTFDVWSEPGGFCKLDESENESGSQVQLKIFQFDSATQFSSQIAITLGSDSACLKVEWRWLNRGSLPIQGRLGVSTSRFLPLHPGSECLFDPEMESGIYFFENSGGMKATEQGCELDPSVKWIPPRVYWVESVKIAGFTGIGTPKAWSETAILAETTDSYRMIVNSQLFGSKVVVQVNGKALEASYDLYPESPVTWTKYSFEGEVAGFVLLDSDGKERLRYQKDAVLDAKQCKVCPELCPCIESYLEIALLDEKELEIWALSPTWRSMVAHEQTARALRRGDFESACLYSEQHLLYNGDDPMAWWERAVALRHAGNLEDDAPELANLHFLSPLDYLLRAESFLRTPISKLPVASHLISALKDCPDMLLEAGRAYIRLNLIGDAVRWLGEAVQVCQLAEAHLLLAFCYWKGSRMDAQSVEHFQKAVDLGLNSNSLKSPLDISAYQELISKFGVQSN